MVIKIFLILLLIPFSVWSQSVEDLQHEIRTKHAKEETKLQKAMEANEEIDSTKYSKSLKELHYQLYQKQADEIIHFNKPPTKQMLDEFDASENTLAALEFSETEVDQISEKVELHIKNQEASIFKPHVFAFADYISWQQDFKLKTSAGSKTLIATNKGYCAGGGYGFQNANYHLFADGCFLYFRGDASAQNTSTTYHQSDVYGWGAKVSFGGGMYVSSAKAEVGLKLPFMYTEQTFDNPNQTSFPGTRVSQPSNMQSFGSLYTRWPFDKWFFQTEFGKRLGKDLTFWSLGLGYKF